MNERIDRWDVLLQNWCRYYHAGGAIRGESSLCRVVVVDRYWGDETYEITIQGDAIDTDRLVSKLEPYHLRVKFIKAWYLWSGTREDVARQCRMSKQNLWYHITRIKADLRIFELQAIGRQREINKVTQAVVAYV